MKTSNIKTRLCIAPIERDNSLNPWGDYTHIVMLAMGTSDPEEGLTPHFFYWAIGPKAAPHQVDQAQVYEALARPQFKELDSSQS